MYEHFDRTKHSNYADDDAIDCSRWVLMKSYEIIYVVCDFVKDFHITITVQRHFIIYIPFCWCDSMVSSQSNDNNMSMKLELPSKFYRNGWEPSRISSLSWGKNHFIDRITLVWVACVCVGGSMMSFEVQYFWHASHLLCDFMFNLIIIKLPFSPANTIFLHRVFNKQLLNFYLIY